MKKRDIINIIIFLLLIVVGFYRYFFRVRSFSETRFLLDTIITINIETKDRNGEEYLVGAYDLIQAMENKLSFYKEGSTIWNFNEGLVSELPLNKDLRQLFDLAGKIYLQSDSLYDVSIGRLAELWDYDKQWVPGRDSIATALKFVDFSQLKFSDSKLEKPQGFKINLGSLAKGFIIDKTYEFLLSKGVQTGFINAGGDIRIFGQKKPLKIGIQHPRDHNNVIATLEIQNKSIVTSGDYERCFIKDGIRYHHILNPKTGYPSRQAVSVTVIADEAVVADAYSTALFMMNPAKAIELVNSLDDIESVILVEEKGEINRYESAGMQNYKTGNGNERKN